MKNNYLGGNGKEPQQNLLNAMNVRWMIYPPQSEGSGPVALPNPAALGNAWLVRELRMLPDARVAFDSLDGTDLATVALAESNQTEAGSLPAAGLYQVDSQASIRLVSYAPDQLKYTFTGNSPAFAVFSEIYYAKGWNAYLDDKPVPHYRVNYFEEIENYATRGERFYDEFSDPMTPQRAVERLS